MKNSYKFLIAIILLGFAATDLLHAQTEVTIRELNTYDTVPGSQVDLPDHPLVGEEVVFDAVITSYPRNSGLANITSAGQPGRIHVFVTDVNAVAEGRDGMSMQLVDPGATRDQLETLFPGDVVRVTGIHTFFNSTVQFDPTDIELIGSINDAQYEDLAELLTPTTIELSEINQPAQTEGQHRWVAENYTKYISRYVKIEGLEVVDRLIADGGRPWYILTDGTTFLTSNDTSIRFRNDRTNYAYDPEEDEGLGYNWRRLADDLDGPFVPPAPGSIVDISGYIVVNPFNPGGFDQPGGQATLKIAPWDDGVVWVNDGTNPEDRTTPENWPNDFVVQGFAPILTEFSVTPGEDEQVFSDTEVSLSIDVLLPEDDYTLESVVVEYKAIPFTEDDVVSVTEDMTAVGGDTYTFTFDPQDEFTSVEYTIVVTARTPEGVVTFGRQEGSFSVESGTRTSPVTFTPAAGLYINQVSVQLGSATAGASIFYTTDGSDPDENSTEYTGSINLTETTTITAIAVSDALDDSPLNARTYDIEVEVIEVATLAELRAGAQDGTTYKYMGEAVVTYNRPSTNRNQRYLMDETAGILIDDAPGTITSTYNVGDVMTGVRGTLSTFGGILQFVPSLDPGEPQATADVEPLSLTLDELNVQTHMSMLVRIEDASFLDSGEFDSGENYDVIDGSVDAASAVTFRTAFAEANYIGEAIPGGVINLVAIVGAFDGSPQLTSRSDADFETPTSNDPGVNPYEFALDQNFPNPFNPSTRINYSLAQTADVQLVVYDILGRRVASLVNGVQSAGTYTVDFDMSRFSSGTYIYRLEAGDYVSVRKMMLIK